MEPVTATGCVCAVEATVAANTPLCSQHVALELIAPEAFPPSLPGQFLQLLCAPPHDEPPSVHAWAEPGYPALDSSEWAGREAYLRRPFSIADRWEDASGRSRLVVISRNIGPGTAFLDRLRPGDRLSITGPLGRGFVPPTPEQPIILVGGGVGIPPLLYLARWLDERGWRRVVAVLGATTRALMPLRVLDAPRRDGVASACAELAGAPRFPAILTTDDGSMGVAGRVTDALGLLAQQGADLWSAGESPLVMACGPDAMLTAVARLTRELGWDCQLCVEHTMGCGLGTCLSCVVRVRAPQRPGGWRWALSCQEGPVFERDVHYDE